MYGETGGQCKDFGVRIRAGSLFWFGLAGLGLQGGGEKDKRP